MSQRKKELIEAESGGLLEFVQSRFDLSFVAGNDQAKRKLQDAANAIRAGNTDVLPMGYVICGPVGTGKTFITTCFAGEVGIPAVTLKNFRSMWQGVTEGNLERVLTLLKAMSPIAVIVDEADAQLGDRSNSGDSGVGNRVFAQIAQFMGNTEYRGKVIWFLLTCRPDLLPVDLKRQGRAEEHIALFYPDTPEERLALLRAMQRKIGMKPFRRISRKSFLNRAGRLSGADIEAVLVRSHMRQQPAEQAAVDAEDLKAALEDFIPPYYPTEIDLQNLVAVLECTSKSLLPKQYRDMDRSRIDSADQRTAGLVSPDIGLEWFVVCLVAIGPPLREPSRQLARFRRYCPASSRRASTGLPAPNKSQFHPFGRFCVSGVKRGIGSSFICSALSAQKLRNPSSLRCDGSCSRLPDRRLCSQKSTNQCPS